MEFVEMAGMRACLQEVYSPLGFGTHAEVAERLCMMNSSLSRNDAKKYMDNQALSRRSFERISDTVKHLLAENYDKIYAYYKSNDRTVSLHFVEALLAKQRNWTVISENWNNPVETGATVIASGIYQMFRRYKPLSFEIDQGLANEPLKHIVAVELVYFDSAAMQCIAITTGRNVYFGSMTINYEHMIYSLMQRPEARFEGNVSSARVRAFDVNIHQRVICLKRSPGDINLHSGLCLKTGEYSLRPVAAECLFVLIPEQQHTQLYDQIRAIQFAGWPGAKIADDSPAVSYISGSYPQTARPAQNVCYIEDFPLLTAMVKSKDAPGIFREPLRSMSGEALLSIVRQYGYLEIYQSNKAPAKDNTTGRRRRRTPA